MAEQTTIVDDDELSCKSICDLIDETASKFYYDPAEGTGYVTFKTKYELFDFCDRITEIKHNIAHLYNSYNCNDL